MSLENVTESLQEGLSLARLAEGEFYIFLLEMCNWEIPASTASASTIILYDYSKRFKAMTAINTLMQWIKSPDIPGGGSIHMGMAISIDDTVVLSEANSVKFREHDGAREWFSF